MRTAQHDADIRRDALVTLGALAVLLAWDASGLDLLTVRLVGTDRGFVWRDSWWAGTLLHDGGRLAAWLLLAGLMLQALRPAQTGTPSRESRWRWLGVTLVSVMLVPTLKRISLSSCPWDLAEFGGVARYLSHWRWGVADGGTGHCFPSGHAVSAFAFFGLYSLWRSHDQRRARVWLRRVIVCGSLFGLAQFMRGAHYPSHTLWTAWLCWTICVLFDQAFRRVNQRSKAS
jgi:membrane-associated PAP2 superfamily phosphatase